MAQQPFTPEGLQLKLRELYALPDVAKEATAIRASLENWLTSNFTFDAGQKEFLNATDQNFLSYAGELTATAVGNRLPITLKLINPLEVWGSKYVNAISGLTPRMDSQKGFTVAGDVTFEVTYVA